VQRTRWLSGHSAAPASLSGRRASRLVKRGPL
jgi:hypothetical protein